MQLLDPGGNKALSFVIESPGGASDSDVLDDWAERFSGQCAQLAEAEQVSALAESGVMRVVEEPDGSFSAWISSKRMPASWRERGDFRWWERSLAERANTDSPDSLSQAHARVAAMAYQFGYPTNAMLGGCTVGAWLDLLARLIERVLSPPSSLIEIEEGKLVEELAMGLNLPREAVRQALSGFTLDRDNTAYHAAVPGIAAAPIVRVSPDRLLLSRYGLLSEPLLFLARELRRRDAEAYHNSGYLREAVFRDDLYALFADKRFVTSAGRINLRRGDGGVRTDIDAAIFDRKSGTLGLFELKSHDPFARSIAELTRQRDNVLYANRQISGTLDWIKRHGADEILHRIDPRAAKTFKAQKVYPFVLGRYLVHFNDGANPDPRAAWGSWPQILRLLDRHPVRMTDANPIASLFSRLSKDDPLAREDQPLPPREIALGDARLMVFSSFATYQNSAIYRTNP